MFGGKVLIVRDEVGDRTAGGIIVPDQSKRRPAMGTVKSVGPLAASVASVGDHVAFSEGVGEELTLDGAKYLIVHVEDIHGKVVES